MSIRYIRTLSFCEELGRHVLIAEYTRISFFEAASWLSRTSPYRSEFLCSLEQEGTIIDFVFLWLHLVKRKNAWHLALCDEMANNREHFVPLGVGSSLHVVGIR